MRNALIELWNSVKAVIPRRIKAEYYCFLKNGEINKFRRFLRSRGDYTHYPNKSILFGMAQQAGKVKTVKFENVPWFTHFYAVHHGILSEFYKENTQGYDFWKGKDVFIVEGIDLSKE